MELENVTAPVIASTGTFAVHNEDPDQICRHKNLLELDFLPATVASFVWNVHARQKPLHERAFPKADDSYSVGPDWSLSLAQMERLSLCDCSTLSLVLHSTHCKIGRAHV